MDLSNVNPITVYKNQKEYKKRIKETWKGLTC